jgi:hypothetical protein
MRFSLRALLLCAGLSTGCGHLAPGESQPLTAQQSAAVTQSVRAFSQTVAADITREGPAAWRRHFSDSPPFFMASEGHLVFPDSASATAAIRDLTRSIKRIELKWGDDLRVDPLAPNLAVLAASYHEDQVNADGSRVNESGFFTGVTEFRDGRWQFRNAHWSVAQNH